ncbi:hypothetical protein [Anaerobacillus sp. 1_MG-2023]|uniref:hypothetical protein n=1 Tax=Anaerobacillus sp. 1_MG-2023 TaxID=3062655 RepID=UPI0026E2777C|nr:hypothetical protein [Anaerobacillus sp. 1_MG-2023]MDO6654514.1 hypothetical protein [Anaerobacillus sp. 1_MG-2023]
MDEIGQLRIYVSDEFFPLYHHIGKSLFQQNSKFFVYCAFVGKRLNAKSPVIKKQELCRAVTLTENDWNAVKGVYYADNGIMGSYKEMTNLMELYAQTGLSYLLQNVLYDHVAKNDQNQEYFFSSSDEDIQMELISYFVSLKEEVPF